MNAQTFLPDSVYEKTADEVNDTIRINKLCRNFSVATSRKEFSIADVILDETLDLIEGKKFNRGIESIIDVIDANLVNIGNYKKSIEYLFKVKETAETISYYGGVSTVLNIIGVIYWQQGDAKQALVFYNENLALFKKVKITGDLSASYNNMGLAYRQLGENEKAAAFYAKSLQICIEENNLACKANAYNNIGTIYQLEGNYEKALYFFYKSLEIREQIPDSIGISMSLGNIGFVQFELGKYVEAEKSFWTAYGISKRLDDREGVKETSEGLSKLYEKIKRPNEALSFYKEFVSVRDSLTSEDVKRELLIREMQFNFEQEEKQKAIVIDADKARQRIYMYMVLIILFIVLTFSVLLYKRFALTQRQKNVIEKQKKLVEEKQKEITDSIHYANRIQTTLLAQRDFLKENLPEHFVLFKPKDIVSGDFYWAAKVKSNNFYLGICDSTGHGVPGAFMSLLNIGFLNEAVKEKNISNPNEVFDYVRKRLIENISQDGGQEGMDGILLRMDSKTITYAAANNSPILISNQKIIQLPSDKMPVGQGFYEENFNLNTIDYKAGDTLYLYTDGYADQFGGPKGKKFKYQPLNELLLSISTLPLAEQSQILNQKFEEWKGDLEQVDDVCIIGIRL
ncbi:MAG: tetratricopeptide repeat protein [Bacteroidia bacterium]|nr:tetratricopeptide repeat protein [Bacteroidia bacterium]